MSVGSLSHVKCWVAVDVVADLAEFKSDEARNNSGGGGNRRDDAPCNALGLHANADTDTDTHNTTQV